MKWLIALLLTCSSVLGQGFGSFTYDQPFLAKTVSSGYDPNNTSGLLLDLDASKNGPYLVAPNTDGSEVTNAIDWSPTHRGTTMVRSATKNSYVRWRNLNAGAYPTNIFFSWTNTGGFSHGIIATNAEVFPLPFTIMAVIQITNSAIISGYSYFAAGQPTGPNAFNIEIPNPSFFRFSPTLSPFFFDTPNPSYIDSKWILLSGTFNTNGAADAVKMYTNGVFLKSGSVTASGWSWGFGLHPGNGIESFPGNIARALVWNHVLTSGELDYNHTNLFNFYQLQN